jgi:nitrogenase iron protein NifH
VLTAIQILRDLKAFDTYGVDVVVYDVLGDVVCGGFAQPIREGYAREIYLVCSGAFMSMYAANNIAKGVQRLARRGRSRLAGIVANSRGDADFERQVLSSFAERLGTSLLHFVPRSDDIQACEVHGVTVLEQSPRSEAAENFRQMADAVLNNESGVIPTPVEELTDLEELYRRYVAPEGTPAS